MYLSEILAGKRMFDVEAQFYSDGVKLVIK